MPKRHQGPRHVRPTDRAGTVAVLAALREQGALTSDRVGLVAAELGVGKRTVWRWLNHEKTVGTSSAYEVSDDDIAELAYWRGNVAAFHRAHGSDRSVRTMRRAFARALTPGRRAGLAGGEAVRRNFDTYLARPPQHRNECWEADHCELAIRVILGDGQVIKPWLTSYLDHYSRAVCGWAISGYPSQESVLAALRAAILSEPPYPPVGGVPSSVRWDRGKEFLGNAIGGAARALAIDARVLPASSPHLKGAIERFHETIETLLLAELPGFTHAPHGRDGQRRDDDAPLLTLDAFIDLFSRFVVKYNTKRPHDGIGGEIPVERFRGDGTPLVELSRHELHHLLLARDSRIVG